jgi:hypothetical protein
MSGSELVDEREREEKEERAQGQVQATIGKRDRMISQVINTNKMRKIYNINKKTIMVKLNRETVNLTSEVNELRKEKKFLATRIKDLQASLRELQEQFHEREKDKENEQSLTDIIPANISVIRSQPSRHSKPLPFQVYHQNKLTQRSSTYSKINSKSIVEEGSTQLPSIVKQNASQTGSFI